MSMNLYCDEIELYQTPTYITYMCLSYNKRGRPDGGWKGVLKRYKVWVCNRVNSWPTQEDYDEWQRNIDTHLKAVDEAVKKHGRLHFSEA